jgi:hypothetical protein
MVEGLRLAAAKFGIGQIIIMSWYRRDTSLRGLCGVRGRAERVTLGSLEHCNPVSGLSRRRRRGFLGLAYHLAASLARLLYNEGQS